MSEFNDRAGDLSSSVHSHEIANSEEYNEDQVKTSIVHGRQDIAAVVSHLDQLNNQVKTIRNFLIIFFWLICIPIVYVIFRDFILWD